MPWIIATINATTLGTSRKAKSLWAIRGGIDVALPMPAPKRRAPSTIIRGAGVYTEIFPDQADRSYFCNCYGVVELAAGRDRAQSKADYHQAF